MAASENSLKHRTARSVKWNVIDKVMTQVLYAVTGIVLARELPQEAFGLVGAILVFQAFASLFVDSGFSYALIQRKSPGELDYSSVFWFNIIISITIYAILWFSMPLIADWFNGDPRLIDLGRVMFLTFILNATAIVQTNRLMKQMNVKPIAISNSLALAVGGVVGVYMALTGCGAWALVWQSIIIAATKSIFLWIYCRWTPMLKMSRRVLASFFGIGAGMMLTSFLNTLFLNIYAFFIGNRAGMVNLGYYSQSDKWSKMGISSVSQVLTSSFLPTLSEIQDEPERFSRISSKINRFTAYLLFPAIFFLIAMATPLFHVLFGAKWDPSIILFQLLLVRGIFTVLNSLYNNYLLAKGHAKAILRLEVLRDTIALAGIFLTLPYINMSTPDNLVYGLTILLLGQIAASFITWITTLVVTLRVTGCTCGRFLFDLLPYFALSAVISCILWAESYLTINDFTLLVLQLLTALGLYIGANALLPSKIQREVLSFIFSRKKRSR